MSSLMPAKIGDGGATGDLSPLEGTEMRNGREVDEKVSSSKSLDEAMVVMSGQIGYFDRERSK